MAKKILLCDCDGVCADFTSYLLSTINSSVAYDDITQWDLFELLPSHEKRSAYSVLKDPKWWERQPTIYQAQRSIEELRRNDWDVVFVTSPWAECKEWGYTRTKWLERNFAANSRDVIVAARKDLLFADAFVDDRASHIREAAAHGHIKNVWLFGAPYNRSDVDLADRRVRDWSELLRRLRD